MELVVGQHDDRHRGVAEVVGKIEPEAVVVDEDGVQWLVKELFRHSPFELIESQIQELELRELQDHVWELAGEAIVADIKLEQKLQSPKLVRHSTTKPVRVYVEQCKINKQAQLLRQVPSNVTVVEINAGDGSDLVVIRCGSTENPSVVTDIRSNPIGGEIQGIRENSFLPSLQCNISISDSWVFENQRRVYGDFLTAVAELVPVVQKLPLPDVQGFSVSEASMGGDIDPNRGTDRCCTKKEDNEECKIEVEEGGVGLPLHLT
jgi:hypothetical protein